MKFREVLNQYCEELECTNNELANVCELDASNISRFRRGERSPEKDSVTYCKIVSGIILLSVRKNPWASEGELAAKIEGDFAESFEENYDERQMIARLNLLMDRLKISNSVLSTYLNYDPSYLSRIRSGQRKISDIDGLAEKVAEYMMKCCSFDIVTSVMKADSSGLQVTFDGIITNEERSQYLKAWLLHKENNPQKKASIRTLMEKIDSFDLNEFIQAIHFDELKIPTLPYHPYSKKRFYGIEDMRKAELNFFKSAVLSRSMGNVTMYSDMNMSEMAEDKEFNKKWMMGIAMMIKKGMRLKVIHCLNRPFDELMLGLEAWIPIYMTGQVQPYYFPDYRSEVFLHLLYTSDSSALNGEGVRGNYRNAMYYHTFREEEVRYYKEKAEDMLQSAKPLMSIFRQNDQIKFDKDYGKLFTDSNLVEGILSAPPAYTMSDELLNEIMKQNQVTEEEASWVTKQIGNWRKQMAVFFQKSYEEDEIHVIEPDSLIQVKESVSLGELFIDRTLYYSPETYEKHLKELKEYADHNSSYRYHLVKEKGFRNIQIKICKEKYVLISKNDAPVINFIIVNPRLREAIENFRIMQSD